VSTRDRFSVSRKPNRRIELHSCQERK
jgi:hypothetical protein